MICRIYMGVCEERLRGAHIAHFVRYGRLKLVRLFVSVDCVCLPLGQALQVFRKQGYATSNSNWQSIKENTADFKSSAGCISKWCRGVKFSRSRKASPVLKTSVTRGSLTVDLHWWSNKL